MERSFKRSRKLHKHVIEHMIQVPTYGPDGRIKMAPALTFPRERAERYIVRITKAMLAKFYPQYDYSADEFTVRQVANVTHEQIVTLNYMQLSFRYEQRGEGAFEAYMGITEKSGAWQFWFFDAVGFTVFHGLPGSWPVKAKNDC